MLKKFACAVALVFVASVALADTVRGLITAASKTEITVVTGKGEDKKTQTIKVAADATVYKLKGRKDKEGEASDFDALAEDIKKAKGKTKGVGASIEVKDKKVTKITYRAGGRRMKGSE